MHNKKIIFGFSLLSVFAYSAIACGSGYMHQESKNLKTYMADVDGHEGKADRNDYTWEESYDALIKEANSVKNLSKIATNFGIDENDEHRTSLARYEIMHEAEELLMKTGAMIPLYNYRDPYLLKPNIHGFCWVNLGYKFFDRIWSDDGRKNYEVTVGTKAETLDPAANSDASTGLILENILCGANKYWRPEGYQPTDPDPQAVLGEGCCVVEKKLVTVDPSKKENPDDWVKFSELEDLEGENPEDYENTARYIITVKPEAKWSDGTRITAFDFTYAWDRASSNTYSETALGIWSSLFDSIRGYDVWNVIGQQENDDYHTWDPKKQEKWEKFSPNEQAQWLYSFKHRKGTRGGLPGVLPDPNDDYKFQVQLVNDSDYFQDQLAFTAFMPIPTKNVISERDAQGRAIKEFPTWWNKPDTFLTNGPLKVIEINNIEGGAIGTAKNEHWIHADDTTVDTVRFRLYDDDSSAYVIYKGGEMQMIDMVAQGVIDQVKPTKDWHAVDQIGLYYALFNVNDNTFDGRPNVPEEERQKYRRILSLLINRYGLCENIVKSGATPANGVVSVGITEKYIPTLGEDGKIKTKYDEHGVAVQKDWHERNKDMYGYLNCDNDNFKNHRLYHRDEEQEEGGFYKVAFKKEDEERVCKENAAEARRIAETIPGLQIVDDADHKEGVGWHFTNFPRINLITNSGTGHESIFEFMQYYYSLFGIPMSIETQEWNSFTAAKRTGNFAVARNGWLADYSDPRTYLDIFRSTDGNNDTQLGKDSHHKSR